MKLNRTWIFAPKKNHKTWTWNFVEQVLREGTWPLLSSMMPRLERGSPCQGFKLSYSFDCTTSEEVIILVIANLFRCASISWIHVGKSVSHSVIDVFEILSNLGHIFRLSSVFVQVMFRVFSEYVQSMFRVFSEYVQSIFRVYSGYVSFHHLAHLVCQFLAFFSVLVC